MTDDVHPRDADLVALLDGVLGAADEQRLRTQLADDPALSARLARLSDGGEHLRAAFAALEPPPPHLSNWLAELPQGQVKPELAKSELAKPVAPLFHRRALALAATLVLGLALGTLAGGLLRTPQGVAPLEEGSPEEWREAVAQYLELYTADTLAELPADAASRDRQLAVLERRLGVALSAAAIAMPELEFKRAQIFDYEGRPLAQIAFLDRSGEPVALCIINGGLPEQPIRTEHRHGIGIAYWSREGRGYLLAGRLPVDRLDAMAADLARRLPG